MQHRGRGTQLRDYHIVMSTEIVLYLILVLKMVRSTYISIHIGRYTCTAICISTFTTNILQMCLYIYYTAVITPNNAHYLGYSGYRALYHTNTNTITNNSN